MAKRKPDYVKEKKELIAYGLLYFFITSFLIKTVFGIISGSKCMLVSGLFALFGVFTAVVALIRIDAAHPAKRSRVYFNRGKIEFIVVVGISAVIALSTSVILFSIGHMIFFHTLYPPELLAAWIAIFIASLNLCFMVVINKKIAGVYEADEHEIMFALSTDFILSIFTIFGVVISRMGFYIIDYAAAIFTAFFVIGHSGLFLYAAFKGLMDASYDKKTIAESMELFLRDAQPDASVETLRVNKLGHIFEIIAIVIVPEEKPMVEAADIANGIKDMVRNSFLKPHEVFVGIRGRRK